MSFAKKSNVNIWKVISKQKAVVILIALFIFLSVATDNFLTAGNLLSLLMQSSAYLVIAYGVSICVIGASPDLSVGGVMSLAGIIAIGLQPYMPVFLACVIAILVGALVGFINGFLVVHQKTEPWVITLGMGIFLRGLNLQILDGRSIYGISEGFANFGSGTLAGIPYLVIVAVVLAVVFQLIILRTPFGRNVFAYGGNYEVAVYSGINARREKWLTFIICGMTAALGGILFSARMNTASAIFGEQTALIVNCSVVIGGVSFTGGVGGIWQAIVGMMLFNVIQNGMNMLGIGSYQQQLVQGLLITVITASDLFSIKRKRELV